MSSLEDALKAADQHAKAEAISKADMFGVLADAPEQVESSYASVPKWPSKWFWMVKGKRLVYI